MLKCKDASSEQSVEGLEAKAQPSMATPATEGDTHPKALICQEWRKVPDSYPKDASGHLEWDQQFINELTKQMIVEVGVVCQLNTKPGAKPKSFGTKSDRIYKHASRNYL